MLDPAALKPLSQGHQKDKRFTCSVMCHGSPFEWTRSEPHSLCCCGPIHHALVPMCGCSRPASQDLRPAQCQPMRWSGHVHAESHDSQLPEQCLAPPLFASAPGQLDNHTDFALTSSLYTLTASDHSEGSSPPPGCPPISDSDLPPEEERLRQHRLSSWGPWEAESSSGIGEQQQQRQCAAAAERSLAAAAARSSSSEDLVASSQAAHTDWADMLLEEQQQGLGEQRQGFGSLLPLGDQATACLEADANETAASMQSSADAAPGVTARLRQVQPQAALLAASSPVPTVLAATAAGLLGNSPQLAVPGAGQQAGVTSQLPMTGSKLLDPSPSETIGTSSWAPTDGRPQRSASLDGFSPGFPSRAERVSSGSPEQSHSATLWQLSDAWQQEEVGCTRPCSVEGLLPRRPMWRMSTQYVLVSCCPGKCQGHEEVEQLLVGCSGKRFSAVEAALQFCADVTKRQAASLLPQVGAERPSLFAQTSWTMLCRVTLEP